MLAYIAFNQSILGPLMPFLRSELHLNYTLGGLLPVAMAIGLIFSGLAGDWLAHRFQRRVVFWGGSLALTLSLVFFTLSHRFEWVFLAALVMGFGSSLTQVMIQALLSDQHGERRAIAFTEANVAASFSATITPFIIGGMTRLGLDWRLVSGLGILLLASLAVPFHREPIPDSPPAQAESISNKSQLPFSFWLYWIVLFLVVAVEMTIAVWATDFLANVASLGRTNAALAFGAFPAAMLIGRLAGSRLTRRWSSNTLLLLTLGITLIGFPLFWLAHAAWLNVLGLFITGLGIANLYPLTLSLAVGLAAGHSNLASARASLGVGLALLSAPLVLGGLADRFGIQSAYGIVILLAGMALVVILFNRWHLPKNQTT